MTQEGKQTPGSETPLPAGQQGAAWKGEGVLMARQAASGGRTEKLEARRKQKLAAASPFQGQGHLLYGT